MTLRTEYNENSTFCAVCGYLLNSNTYGGALEGVLDTGNRLEDVDIHLCKDHVEMIKTNIAGGLIGAQVKTAMLRIHDEISNEDS